MANKVVNQSYNGMSQDITKSKFSNEFYFEGRNVRIISTDSQSTGSITNEKGNKFILTIPKPVINTTNILDKKILYNNKSLSFKTNELNDSQISGEQVIIGQCTTKKYIILFTTDNNGFDCIWKVDYVNYDLTLIYTRNMGFSINYPIQCINNYENESLDKIYFIDGKSQVKFLNLEHSILNKDIEELIDINLNSLESTSIFKISQPVISNVVKGGLHTSGMIQYAYNLYKVNSSESKISPMTSLISLDKFDLGGGKLNEIVSSTPIVNINNIDSNFTHIKVYAIKYTSYNEIPSVSLIKDQLIPSSRNLEIFDDGFVIKTISLENFLFLGSGILIPKHIESKKNRLFLANYKEVNFEVTLDCRAYSFNNLKVAKVYKNVYLDSNNTLNGDSFIINGLNYDDPYLTNNDSINLDYNSNKYQSDGITYGGEGKYLKYELTQDVVKTKNSKFFKDDEIYRCGIVFYNSYGQSSFPNWISDFKSRDGNLNNLYNTFKLTLKPEFYTWLNSNNFQDKYDKPVGYKLLIAQRNLSDKTIVVNGILSPMMVSVESAKENDFNLNYRRDITNKNPKLPNILLRNCGNSTYGNTAPLRKAEHVQIMTDPNADGKWFTELQQAWFNDKDTYKKGYQFTSMMQIYSPETLFNFNQNLQSNLKLKVKGVVKNTENACWYKNLRYQPDNVTSDEGKCFGGISPSASSSVQAILGDPYNPMSCGLISYPGGSQEEDDRAVTHMNFYRNYSNNLISTILKNNIKSLVNDLNDLNLNDPLSLKIKTINSLRGIQFNLTQSENKLNLQYTFTPSPGFQTTLYSIKIYSDDNGTNIIDSLNNVSGNQTIIIDYILGTTSLTIFKNYFFTIETLSNITINVDVNCKLGNSSNLSLYNKKSLLNNYVINSQINTNSLFTKSNDNNLYNVYGTPELTERGQDYKSYNNDAKYRYSNSLQSVGTDGNTRYDENGDLGRKIVSVNSYNNRCTTIVLYNGDPTQDHWLRPTVEQLYNETQINVDSVALIAELVISDETLYLGNIYGGNSYESKKRTNYLEVGNYKNINEPVNYVNSPGDTFVENFKFQRISRLDSSIVAEHISQFNEIVEVVSETTIDLKNRNDYSLNAWDNIFQPLNSNYEKYNKVYSQQNNFITKRDVNFNFKKINNFETNVIASKLKSSGELIDSWTDYLPNEVLTLNGKYGAVNAFVNFNDDLYTIQDRAFAKLSISPRIQVQGSDGIAVQLGSGQILDDYDYISNIYGTLNKWSVVVSPEAIYFYDILNKSFNIYKGQIGKLSNLKGMHHYFLNNTNTEILKIDNPLLKTGISSGFDYINNDVFMTLHQSNKSFNISYNEQSDTFISFYDYLPSIYISRGDYFITTSPDLKNIYRQYEGNYNEYYNVKYKSSFIFNVNPEPTLDCVFDNIGFKSDVTLNEVDQVDKTITNIQAYNDYQDSGLIPLIVGRNNNLRRKFRDWNALIPREGRNRIRAPYIKLKLEFENTMNYKLIFHDTQIYYTTY